MSCGPQKDSLPQRVFHELLTSLEEAMLTSYNPVGVLSAGSLGGYLENKRAQEDIREAVERKKIKQALQRLEDQHLIKLQKKGEEVHFKLTDKGFGERLKFAILSEKKKIPNRGKCYSQRKTKRDFIRDGFSFRLLV